MTNPPPPPADTPVLLQRPMTLVMPLADPSYANIERMAQEVWMSPAGSALTPDLDEGGTVHFARFVIIENNLVMASSYDGDFGDYIQMFIHTMGDVFDLIMGFIANPAPVPVRDHPDAFVDWVASHNKDSIGFYSAYPQISAMQIREAFNITERAVKRPTETPPPPLQADQIPDIQGLILRGLGQSMVRHLVLKVVDPASARISLGAMADETKDGPKVTSGADWGANKPKSAIALGITATGMEALELPEASRASFPVAFREGAVERAPRVGDWDVNSPDYWGPLADTNNVHILVSVYASTADDLTQASDEVTSHFGAACTTTSSYDGAVFADNKNNVHFGYRDSISQPIIDGDPVSSPPDGPQPLAPPGEFLLGYESQYGGVTLDIPQPAELGINGSFTAFRVLEQKVDDFEKFLETVASKLAQDKEYVAAKIVGRWRNGVPLVTAPGPEMPPDPQPGDDLNNYGYQADDAEGLRCPMGSHMRRANPRDQPMHPVGDNHRRRIIRRGMPYGPEWKAGEPAGDATRGLLGHFIGASLTLQFETIMGEWINRGMTNPEITGSNDLLIGVHQEPNTFKVPLVPGKPPLALPVGKLQFTYTRGSIYAFLPSMTALRWIGDLET